MEQFVGKQAPDTRGRMEKIMQQFVDKNTFDTLDGNAEGRIANLKSYFEGVDDTEARLLYSAHTEMMTSMLLSFGRAIDELPGAYGLRAVGISYILNGLQQNIQTLIDMNNQYVASHMFFNEIPTTDGCDCASCQYAKYLESHLDRRTQAMVERGVIK